jgi:acyl-CoA thioesterase II
MPAPSDHAPTPDGQEAMTELDRLVALLSLERLDDLLFRGACRDRPGERVFGGQVLGQALMAAGLTVSSERVVHSLHAYFMRPGDSGRPIIYTVERARDGGSFSTRRVVASQAGRPIFNCSASFQRVEPGETHQISMPEVPEPECLPSQGEIYLRHLDHIPAEYRGGLFAMRPIVLRPTVSEHPVAPGVVPTAHSLWLKADGRLADDPLLHQAILAYASDYRLLGTAMRPHGRTLLQGKTMLASLDHALWLHRPFRVDDWLLYSFDSPSASNARGFARGSIFRRDGTLVASVAQEGLMRPLDWR